MENEMNVKLGLDTKKYNEKIGEALSSYDSFVRTVNQHPAKFHFNTDSLQEINKVFKDIRKTAFNELNAISKQLNKISVQKMSINLDNSGVIASMDKIKEQYGELEAEARKYQAIIDKNNELGSIASFDAARSTNDNFLKSEGMNPTNVPSKTGVLSIDISNAALDLATKKLKEAQNNMNLLDQDAEKLNAILENNDIKLEKLSKAAEPLQASFETIIGDLQANPLEENFDSSVLQQYNGEVNNVNDGLKRTGEELDDVDEKTNRVHRSSTKLNLMGRIFSQIKNTIAAAINPLNIFRRHWNEIIMSDDSKFGNTFKTIAANINTALTPVFEKLAQWIINLIGYVNVFLKALSGGKIDLFAKTAKSAKSTATSMKEANKQLAGFDEINDISESSGGGGSDVGGGDPGIVEPELKGEWVEKLTEWGEKVKEIWGKIKDFFSNLKDHLGTVGLVVLGIGALVAVFLLLGKVMGGIMGPLIGIGVALLGVAAVLVSIANLMTVMEETGTSIGDLALIMVSTLGILAVAVVAFAAATKMIDLVGLAALVVIFVGMVAVMTVIKDLLVTMTEKGISATDMLATMGVVVGSIIVLVAALTAAAMVLGSNPLALIAVVALAGALIAILLVMEKVVPVILDAMGRFTETIAPPLCKILDVIFEGISKIIYAIGTTLPPIIKTIGSLFESIFNGIAKVIKTVGDVIIGIMNTAKSLITGVLQTIIDFINQLGPAINNFVDNMLQVVTKLVNFIVSAVEFLVNTTVVDGINTIIRGINSVGQYVGFTIPLVPDYQMRRFVPSYDVGTNFVPNDQLAMVHKGEAIIPAKFNDEKFFGNNEDTNRLLEQVIDAINNIEINPYTTVKEVGAASIQYIKDKSRQLGRSVI